MTCFNKQYSAIQIRRGSNSEFVSSNPVLASGEPSYAIDSKLFKIGDGVTPWLSLPGLIASGSLLQFSSISSSGLATLITDETGFSIIGNQTSGVAVFSYSPTLTGIPLAPTAASGTNTNQIATTSFVRTEVSNLVDSAPAMLDTLNELAAAINDDSNFYLTINNNITTVSGIADSKVSKSGDTMTGALYSPSGIFTHKLSVGGVDVSVSGHTHVSSDITNFNTSVSGLLPTIANSGDNRLLTSTGSTVGINAESNLTFNGSQLTVTGNVSADFYFGAFDGPIVLDCKNNTVSTINKGTPVYISGHFANGKVYVEPADASNSAKMPAIGLLGDTLTSGQEGHVYILGSLSNIDTTAYNDPADIGKVLYVASGGGLTLTRPTSESVLIQNIARIARIHNNGRLIVLGAGRTNDVPNSINAYKLDIDNVRIDGSTISSIDGNSLNITTGQAAGDLRLGVEGINFANGYSEYYITTSGTTDLLFDTNAGIDTGYIRINSGLGQDIEIASSGNVLFTGNNLNFDGTTLDIDGLIASTSGNITTFNSIPTYISPSALGADTDNWNPGYGDVIRVSGITTGIDITGLVAPTGIGDNYTRIIINIGLSNNLTLKHDTTSTSGNRFLTPIGGDHIIPPSGTCAILYDTVSSRWRVL